MDLSLKYTTNSDSVKSQSSQGQIGLMLSYNGKPYDLHVISDGTITAKIGNDNGFIQDINIDLSKLDDDAKYRGTFTIPLDDPNIQNLPPDTYYLEVWINVKDQNNNENNLIFPSEGVLPFMLSANIVDGSNSMPMITYENIQKNINDFEDLVMQNQAKLSKDLSTMDTTTSNFVDKVDSGVSGYSKFVNSADDNLTSMASSGASYINNAVVYANNNVSDINSKVDSARNQVNGTADNVFSIVNSNVVSAKNSIADVVTSADNDTTGTASHATSTIDSEAASVVTNVTSTMNSADNHIDHAADGIRGDVNGIVTSGNNYINNVKNNMINTANSAVNNINNAAGNIDSKTDSAVQNINLTVNSADNYATNLTNDTNNKLTSADSHVDSTVTSADTHMSNFASDINNRTDSADSHIDSHVSSADVHVDSLFNTTNGKTASAASYIDSRVNGIDGQARSAYTRIHSSAHSVTDSADSNISSITVSGVDTLDGVVSGAAAHLRKGVTSDVTSNVNHSMDDLRSDMASNNKDVASNDSDVSALNSHVDMTRKDIATVYNQLFTSNAMNRKAVSDVSSSLSSQINDDETKSDANDTHTSLVGQIASLSAANKNLGDVLGSNTGSKLASLAKQFNDFDNTTQAGLSNSIASNATTINNVATSVNNSFNQTNANIQNNYNDLRGYDDALQRQITDNNNAHNGNEANLQNQINQNKNDISNNQSLYTTNFATLQDTVDLNKILKIGIYKLYAVHLKNLPSGVDKNGTYYGHLKITPITGKTGDGVDDRCEFLILEYGPNNDLYVYARYITWNNFFGTWEELNNESEINDLRNNVIPDTLNRAISHTDDKAKWLQGEVVHNWNSLNDYKNDLQNQINQTNTNISFTDVTNSNNIDNLATGQYLYDGKRPGGLPSECSFYGVIYVVKINNAPTTAMIVYDSNNLTYTRYKLGYPSNWTPWSRIMTDSDKNAIISQSNQAAINALNQANSNMEINRRNLQGSIDTVLSSYPYRKAWDGQFSDKTLDLNISLEPGRYEIFNTKLKNGPSDINGMGGVYGELDIIQFPGMTDKREILYIEYNYGSTLGVFCRYLNWQNMPGSWASLNNQNQIDVLNNHANNVDGKINEAEQMAMQMKSNYDSEISQLKDHDRETAEALKSVTDALRQLSAKTNDYNYNDDLDFISSQVEAISNGMLD